MRVPPELLPPEARAPRMAELEREIGGAWRRFALLDALAVTAPLALAAVLYALSDVSLGVLVVVAVAGLAASAALTVATVVRRVRPAQRELEDLRRLQARDAAGTDDTFA